ncbi:MAG TPA: hypothetical protein VFD84_16800 [Candidatus Binatia bacterium]|nr:hypothetical protein [Candidatus Binatia bacterium]
MARLAPLDVHALSWRTRLEFWLQRRLFGKVLRPYPILARAPRVTTGAMVMNAIFGTGRWTIGPELRTLIHLRVAQIVGCVF